MTWALWFLAAAYLPVAAAWWWHARRVRVGLASEAFRLTPQAAWPADRPAPPLAVVLACHNEQARIADCLRHLTAQSYPALEIVVANDRSSDRTAQVLARLAARERRLRVVEIRALPPGWIGKPHALARAVDHCDSQYLLFLDADVQLAPQALPTVMHKVCAERLEFLSLWPHVELRGRWERLLAPPAMMLLGLWGRPPARCPDPARHTVLGNGQFLLMRRAAYQALGGHAAVRQELAEDLALARKAHAARQRCWVGLGQGVCLTRRSGTFGQTVNALARMLIGAARRPARILCAAQLLLAGAFSAVWIPALALTGLPAGWNAAPCAALLLLALLHWAGMLLALHRAFAVTIVRRGTLLGFPLGALLLAGVLLWCAYLLTGRGTIRWGPTRYRLRGRRVVAVAGRQPAVEQP